MGYREDAFQQKFSDAATHLGSTRDQIVSLKVREDIGHHDEYRRLLDELRHEAGIQSKPVNGNLQGSGHLVENSKTKVIVVEHETGLEILYIASSIASIIGIIPLILKCWSVIRHHHPRHPHDPDVQRIEIRRLDGNGQLVETHNNGLAIPWAAPLSVMNTALLAAAENIDEEMQRLRNAVTNLTTRVETLEKSASKPQSRAKKGK